MMIGTGLIYSLGYFSDRVYTVVEDHVPMEPAPVGMFVLFCIGATLGMYSACLVAPTSYLTTAEGREFKRRMTGTDSRAGFRPVAFSAVAFVLLATFTILHYVIFEMRE